MIDCDFFKLEEIFSLSRTIAKETGNIQELCDKNLELLVFINTSRKVWFSIQIKLKYSKTYLLDQTIRQVFRTVNCTTASSNESFFALTLATFTFSLDYKLSRCFSQCLLSKRFC